MRSIQLLSYTVSNLPIGLFVGSPAGMRNLASAVLSGLNNSVTQLAPICFVDSTGIKRVSSHGTDVDLIATSSAPTKYLALLVGI